MRTASSASTRFRLSARNCPNNNAEPESRTSAFGALATIAWSRSRTMMSRIRTAIRIRPARSICVPPTSTVLPCPIFCSIAVASQGVTMSRLIGPAPSRHHRLPKQPAKITSREARNDGEPPEPAPAGQRTSPRSQAVGKTVKTGIRSGQQTAAPGAEPPRRVPHASQRRPTASAGRRRTGWDAGSTYVLPLPLVAGADGPWRATTASAAGIAPLLIPVELI